MIRIILVFGFFFTFVLPAMPQTTVEKVNAETLNIQNLPIRIKEAEFNNLEHQADFYYSVTNLTDDEIWNYTVMLYFFDPTGTTIKKKIEVCLDEVVKPNFGSCRYVPPVTSLEPGKTEENSVILDNRVEANTKIIAVVKEVRGSKGIWQIDKLQLQNAVYDYAKNKSVRPIKIRKKNHIAFTLKDKIAVMNSALEKAILYKQIPDYHLLADKKKDLVLSTENIPSGFEPKIPGTKIIKLSFDKIREKADKDGDYLFLSLQVVKANDDKIFVVLSNTWAQSKFSKAIYLSGGATFFEFHKKNGKWIGRNIGGLIS